MKPIEFVHEAYGELKKSAWLTRQQAVGSAVVVAVLVGIMAVYVSSIDFVLSIVFGALLGR